MGFRLDSDDSGSDLSYDSSDADAPRKAMPAREKRRLRKEKRKAKELELRQKRKEERGLAWQGFFSQRNCQKKTKEWQGLEGFKKEESRRVWSHKEMAKRKERRTGFEGV